MIKKLNKILSVILILSLSPFAKATEEYTLPKDETKLPIKLLGEFKKEEKQEEVQKVKLFGKKKIDYTKYLIPTEGYMPVGGERENDKIEGSISKSPEYDLADCLELALVNNPKIKAAYANAASYKARRGQVVSGYTPHIDLGSSITRMKPDVTSGSKADPYTRYLYGSIGVSQLVYDFGVIQNKWTISKLDHKASIDAIDVIVNDVIFQVKDAYYYLILALQNEIVMKETVEQFERCHRQAVGFYEVGLKPKINVTISEVNLSDARAKLIEAQYEVDKAVSRLNNVMGLPFISPYVIDAELPNEDIEISIKEVIEIANKERPELKIALTQVELADQYVKLAKKSYFPQLLVDGSYSAGEGRNDSNGSWYTIGGYLQFPTLNPILIKNQIDEAKHLYTQQQYSTKSSVNDIYLEIQETYATLLEKKDRVPVAELGVKQAFENYEIAEGRYNVGLSDPIEFKDAQIALMDARISYLRTLYDFNSTKARLERAVGQTLKGSGKPVKSLIYLPEEKPQEPIHEVNELQEPLNMEDNM